MDAHPQIDLSLTDKPSNGTHDPMRTNSPESSEGKSLLKLNYALKGGRTIKLSESLLKLTEKINRLSKYC